MKKENRYDSLFQFYGYTYKVDWELLKAQSRAESNLNPNAKSPAGACGLSQTMPKTFSAYAKILGIQNPNIWDVEQQIQCQARMMSDLIKQFKGNIMNALQAYNWGSGNLTKFLANEIKEMPKETVEYPLRVMKFLSKN